MEKQLSGKISVWWDLENCPVPKNSEPRKVTCNIFEALRKLGYVGEISIYAYGSANIFSQGVLDALNSSGVLFNHVSSGKDAADRKMIVDMMLWGHKNPPPANYLLISGDKDFWHALEVLKEQQYNIMLSLRSYPRSIEPPADTVWEWDSLSNGGPPQ